MRKLRTVSAALALCIGVLTLCSCNMAADPDKIEITPIEKLNTSAGELNDHAEEWELSQLEPNFRQYVEVGSEKLRIKNAIYPRIKKLADGSYILFYQDGQIGWNSQHRSGQLEPGLKTLRFRQNRCGWDGGR